MEDSDKKQLDRIEKMMLDIINHFGINTNVVRLVDIRERAHKAAELALQKAGRKNGR